MYCQKSDTVVGLEWRKTRRGGESAGRLLIPLWPLSSRYICKIQQLPFESPPLLLLGLWQKCQRHPKNSLDKSPFQFVAMSFYYSFPGRELVDALIDSSLWQPGSQMQVSCFSSLPSGFGLYLWMKRAQWFRTCMMISSPLRLEVHWWHHMRISTPGTHQNIKVCESLRLILQNVKVMYLINSLLFNKIENYWILKWFLVKVKVVTLSTGGFIFVCYQVLTLFPNKGTSSLFMNNIFTLK